MVAKFNQMILGGLLAGKDYDKKQGVSSMMGIIEIVSLRKASLEFYALSRRISEELL